MKSFAGACPTIMTTPIPQPSGIPFIGNITDVDSEVPTASLHLLAKQYGECYQLNFLGSKAVFLNSHALVNEASNDIKFKKVVESDLAEVRKLAGDGLFTAHWGIAHRLLMPAFSTLAIRDMFENMRDVRGQLSLKWERFGPDHVIDPSDDFTRVALDTIALCSMSYRKINLDLRKRWCTF
ncbi:hypothetical protein PM082_001872 [Marasmius tenuissimus]|nr:hypothetical protein PM082_001872 [Marasmius tenuissimus]